MTDHSPTAGFARRLADLRATLQADPAATGDQGLKLLEEYLEYLALECGYRDGRGSIGRYVSWLRRHGPLSAELLDRADGYAEVRNCLAHSYGLQTSPALAAEIVEFLAGLLHQELATAAQMMSSNLRTIGADEPLRAARDLMLRVGFGRLPVLRDGVVVGLLTERDIVAAEAQAERGSGLIDQLTVAAALPHKPQKGGQRRFLVVAARAPYDEVLSALRRPGVEALIVTADGRASQRPVGIITHADVLYRL